MKELDRVLDRHDVVRPLGVDDVDEPGERRRLTRTGDTGDEDQTPAEVGELLNRLRKAQLIQGFDAVGDQSHDRTHRVALLEDVDPEARSARKRVGQVELLIVLELLALLLGEHRVDQFLEILR
jgi:hypothetical protein